MATVAVSVLVIVGVFLYFYAIQDYKETPQGEQNTLDIEYTILEAKQISPTEIELKVEFNYSTPIAWENKVWIEPRTITCGGWSPHQCNSKTCPVYTDSYGIHHNEKIEYVYSKFTATYPSLSTFCEPSTTKTFSGTTGSTTTYSLIISNFCAMGQTSVSIPVEFTFSDKTQVYYYHSRDYRICGDSQCKCYTLARGDHTSSGTQINGVVANKGTCVISLTSSQVSNPNNIPVTDGPRTTNPNITNLATSFEDNKLIITFYTQEKCKYKFYVREYGKYVLKKTENTEALYHKLEYTYPKEIYTYPKVMQKIYYKIETFYTNMCNVDYSSVYEGSVDVPIINIPKININITKHSITGNKLEVRFKIENETDKTEKHFFYREIGHGIIEPELNKLGDEYGIELSLQNGNYEYWIYAKDGDQEVTTDKVRFTINVEDEGIKFTKTNEKIGTTTYGLSFKLNERLDDVSYKYKKKDDPISELKEGHIPRFGYEYNFSLSNLTPDTLYELDVFAGNENVYSTVFRTHFTQEDQPQTTPPSDETNGISVNSFFVIIAIIAGLFYYVYTQIKKGGKKR